MLTSLQVYKFEFNILSLYGLEVMVEKALKLSQNSIFLQNIFYHIMALAKNMKRKVYFDLKVYSSKWMLMKNKA